MENQRSHTEAFPSGWQRTWVLNNNQGREVWQQQEGEKWQSSRLFFIEYIVKFQHYFKTKRNETGNNHNRHGMRQGSHWNKKMEQDPVRFFLGHLITMIIVYSSFSPVKYLLFNKSLNLVFSEDEIIPWIRRSCQCAQLPSHTPVPPGTQEMLSW